MTNIDEFYDIIDEYNVNKDVSVLRQAEIVAKSIPQLKHWPKDAKIFWDVEAYSWHFRINAAVRVAIIKELDKIKYKSALSLGSGSKPYIRDSVCADLSYLMLKECPNKERVLCDAEKGLPFSDRCFDLVTCIFLLNYLKNPEFAITEARRVLKDEGVLFVVSSKVSRMHKVQEKHEFSMVELKQLLSEFKVESKVLETEGAKLNILVARK